MSRIVIDTRAKTPVERKAAIKAAVEPRNAAARAAHKAAVLEEVAEWRRRPGRG